MHMYREREKERKKDVYIYIYSIHIYIYMYNLIVCDVVLLYMFYAGSEGATGSGPPPQAGSRGPRRPWYNII